MEGSREREKRLGGTRNESNRSQADTKNAIGAT